MSRILARVENLVVHFAASPRPAVDGVSVTVHAGECVALVGESGSGKTLTARALLGLLPAAAVVAFDWLDVVDASGELAPAPPARARAWTRIRGARAGLVPQDALGALDPLRRVEHEVGDALRLHRLASGEARRRLVTEALASTGVPEPERRMRQRADELSGGLKQRALVASALIADPELIVADEPTTALDAGHRGRVLDELRRRVDAGAGALLITHDLASALGTADRVLVMRHGRVIEAGSPDRVLRDPEHPFTRELLDASPAGKSRGARLLPAEPGMAGDAPPAPEGTPAAEKSSGRITHTAAPRLALEGVAVSFGSHRVLDNVTLAVAPGETVGLVGESGSGKTTLLRIALGLHSPDAGTVLVDGVDRSTAGRRERRELRRRIAFVPQDPLDSFPRGATGGEVLRDALRAAGAPRSARPARALGLAHEVGLSAELLEQPAASLSGGQRQRVAIARALARDPELLLLDEPVSALDVTVQARVLDLLDELQRHRGTAYLLVSHDLEVIRHMSDRVLQLESGVIAAQER